MLEFRHARHNIVHNVQIFIKRIQADGPTCVPRRQVLKHTPQVTSFNINPFPFKIYDSLEITWREKKNANLYNLKVIKDYNKSK